VYWGFVADPIMGSLQHSSDPIAGLEGVGPLGRGRKGEREKRRGKEEGKKGRGKGGK